MCSGSRPHTTTPHSRATADPVDPAVAQTGGRLALLLDRRDFAVEVRSFLRQQEEHGGGLRLGSGRFQKVWLVWILWASIEGRVGIELRGCAHEAARKDATVDSAGFEEMTADSFQVFGWLTSLILFESFLGFWWLVSVPFES